MTLTAVHVIMCVESTTVASVGVNQRSFVDAALNERFEMIDVKL